MSLTYGVEFKRIALNPEHISQYNLSHDPTAAKRTDPRYEKYVQKYGNVAVELDALHPRDLEQMIRSVIEAEIDMEAFEEQQQQEYEDEEYIENLRDKVKHVLEEHLV